jgi:hypothetical protein
MPKAIETGEGTRAGRPLLLHVWVRTLEPVGGRIALDGRRAAGFEGWLDLLQRLSDLVASALRSQEPMRRSGSSPRAELRNPDLPTVADRTDHGSGVRRFIRDDTKEET